MNKGQFWSIIDSTRAQAGGDPFRHIETLREALKQLKPGEIVQFDSVFREYWVRAYSWSLWGAAYVIGGGCSDDGFMDFRGWLISKGQVTYEAVLQTPDALADLVTDQDGDGQVEGFSYAAAEAWAIRTQKEISEFPAEREEQRQHPAGEPWSEDNDELEMRYPKLCAKFP